MKKYVQATLGMALAVLTLLTALVPVGVAADNPADGYVVGNDMSEGSPGFHTGWTSVQHAVEKNVTGISPDGATGRFSLDAAATVAEGEGTRGEIVITVDHSENRFSAQSQALVFWMKTPDVSNALFTLYPFSETDGKWDENRLLTTNDIQLVSSVDGTVTTVTPCDHWLVLPANFEGYVVIPLTNIKPVSDTATAFHPENFFMMKLAFDWNQTALQNKNYYIDNIGLAADTAACVQCLSEQHTPATPTEPAKDPHESHDDNKYMAVATGFEDESSYSDLCWGTTYRGIAKDISPDGSCAEIKFGEDTRGEVFTVINTAKQEDYAKSKAVAFWVKAPEFKTSWYVAMMQAKTSGEGFSVCLINNANSDVSMTLVSAKDGSVENVPFAPGSSVFSLPGEFEGYVILLLDDFTKLDTFDPSRFQFFALCPDWNQAMLANQSFYFDDVGMVADVDAYVNNLVNLYKTGSDPSEPEDPEDPDDPSDPSNPADNVPAYEKDVLAYEEDYTVSSVSGKKDCAVITWEALDGVDHYVVHVYEVQAGKNVYLKSVKCDKGASTATISELVEGKSYLAQVVAMTATDEIIFAYVPAKMATGTENVPATGYGFPALALVLMAGTATSVIAFRRKKV